MPLTDFVVADLSKESQLAQSYEPKEYESLDVKGIDPSKLGVLYAILTDDPDDQELMSENAPPAYSASEDGPWVQRVPDDLIKRLAEFSGETEALYHLAEIWSRDEAFSEHSDALGGLESFLVDFAALCKRATQNENSVFMWMCL